MNIDWLSFGLGFLAAVALPLIDMLSVYFMRMQILNDEEA